MAENANKRRVPVTVRVPRRILEQIDTYLGQEELPVSRNRWIVEAMVEKLRKSEIGNGSNGSR